jgi:prolyl oligopeptidase
MRTTLALVALACAPALAGSPTPPVTPKKPVQDEFFGTTVAEDYRWLENWDDPAVKKWSEEQNAYCRAVLDALPGVEALRKRIGELRGINTPSYTGLSFKGGQLFALKTQPPKQQPFVVVLKSADDLASEKVVVDPNQIDPSGHTSMDFYVPSRDGKLVAVSLSEGGSESGSIHIFETGTGKQLQDVIPRVNGGTAGGSVAWNADGTGLFYTRYPRGHERAPEDMDFYQQVYFHLLRTPTDQDTYEIGKDFPRIAEVALDTSDDGAQISAAVANGDGGDFAHYIRMRDGAWRNVSGFEDHIVKTHFGCPGVLTVLSLANAPRGQLAQINLDDPSILNIERLLPQSESVIEDFARTRSQLFVLDLVGGPNQIRLFDHIGTPEGLIPILPVSTVDQMVALGENEILYHNESFLSPPAWYRVNAENVTPVKTAMSKTSPVDYSGYEVVRETATSKDGTKVPVNIIRKKGIKLDGTNPTLLWGYGGYSISEQPGFSEARMAWLEQGGVFCVANIRGGGEFGEEWHKQGNLTRKQNVFDDFYACMKHLVDAGYCTKEKLAIYGGSNGGLLMGAMITQHPDAFAAVSSSVGIYDMLRVELSSNGAFNVTEFGTVKNEELFHAMYAYSPYHNVKDGVKYPPVLMMTGANDPRVDPMQSRKMIARLQAANPGGTYLLRTSANAGHGVGASLNQRIEEDVDRFAFLFHNLGVTYKPVK